MTSYRERSSSNQARIQEIERAKRAALIQQTETLCASQKAHTNAVLKRLGLQQDTPSSCQPSPSFRRIPKFSLQQGGIHSDLNIEEKNCSWTSRNTETWDEQDQIFEKTLHQDSRSPKLKCMVDELYTMHRSLSPDDSVDSVDSLSTVDSHTPSDLRAISPLRSPDLSPFTPTPPQTTSRRRSCIPVKISEARKFILLSNDSFL